MSKDNEIRTEQTVIDELVELEAKLQQKLTDVQVAIKVLYDLKPVSHTVTEPAPEKWIVTPESHANYVNNVLPRPDRECVICGKSFTPKTAKSTACKNPKCRKKVSNLKQRERDKLKKNLTKQSPKQEVKYLKPLPASLPT